jgi:PAS domain S-box-containing protein
MAHSTSSPRDDEAGRSPQQQVIDRLRFILLICSSVAALFTVRELLVSPETLGARFAVRLIGIGLAMVTLFVLSRPWAERLAWPLAIVSLSIGYILTALAGAVSPTHEYVTTAVVFVGAALTGATVMPWGFGAQCATALVGAAALAAGVLWKDGNLHVLATDPGAAVLIALVLSAITAREFDRHRAAVQRELRERRRAEEALRRLNVHLEDRVVERTTALQNVNDRMAAEVGERRRINDALRASEALLADTVDNSTAIVSLKDIRGRYLLVNREFERVLGHPRLTAVGRRDGDLFLPALAAQLGARDEQVLRAGAPVSFEQELLIGDLPRSYVCVKFPLHGADGAPYGVGSMATDITVLKQLQEELRRHQDELAHVLRLYTIGEMAAAMAHEINQPLCAITNYAQGGAIRLRGGSIDAAALLQAFEHISAEGLRAGQILRSVRSLVRREHGEETAVDVNLLAGEAVRMLEAQARLHGVTVRLEGGGGIPPVQANATQIEQVMVNLMLNGLQATAGAAHAKREVVVTTARSGDSVEVTVRDTGHGIVPAMAEKLFTPFATTKAHGLGLGLAISRSIVEQHGGRLWNPSDSGPGATFRFSLPLAAGEANAER